MHVPNTLIELQLSIQIAHDKNTYMHIIIICLDMVYIIDHL